MNTANLQLEGVYAILGELLLALRARSILSGDEIDGLLQRVEKDLARDAQRPLRAANIEAICFPVRFLRFALAAAADGDHPGFAQVAVGVGRSKQDH